jgi:hypothetical protein
MDLQPQAGVHQSINLAIDAAGVCDSGDRGERDQAVGEMPVTPDERLDVQQACASAEADHRWSVELVVTDACPRHQLPRQCRQLSAARGSFLLDLFAGISGAAFGRLSLFTRLFAEPELI